jgi:transcriptional regulator with XRE-family HTH domain
MNKALSKNIKQARKKKGWSQEQLARKLEVSRSLISKVENKGMVSNKVWELLPVIMEYFGISQNETFPFLFTEDFSKKD